MREISNQTTPDSGGADDAAEGRVGDGHAQGANGRACGLGSARLWRWVIAVGVALLVLRVAVQAIFSPYALVADEAHYWDWAQRPSLSYYTKGPGVAMAIWASTNVLGDEPWAVRAPAAVSGLVMLLAVMGLAWCVAGGDRARRMRAAGLAGVALLCIPIFQGVAQFMTIDGPFLACWALASLVTWRAFAAAAGGRLQRSPDDSPGSASAAPVKSAMMWWGLAGLIVGVGFLFKYTILLLLPGWIIWALIHRTSINWRGMAGGITAFALLLIVGASPVLIWNVQHGWPTVAHLLGHLHMAGGDGVVHEGLAYDPMWTLEWLGGQLGVVGPGVWLLMILGLFLARHNRSTSPDTNANDNATDPHPFNTTRLGSSYLLWCGLPVWVFYGFVSLRTDVEANWPIGAYVTWSALAGVGLATLAANRIKPASPTLVRLAKAGLALALVVGIISQVVLIAGVPMMQAIGLGDRTTAVGRLVSRAKGNDQQAAMVQALIDQHASPDGTRPMVIANYYTTTALLRYNLPGRPVVYCGMSRLGGRINPYDYFTDTDLADPSLHGRDAILVGSGPQAWRDGFAFGSVQVIDQSAGLYVGYDYQGIRDQADPPSPQSDTEPTH